MQKLCASIGFPGDPAVIRQNLLRVVPQGDTPFALHLPLKDFAIPGDLVLEKEIVVHARVVRDDENINDTVKVEFKAATEAELFPTFVGTLDVYPAEYGNESVLEISGVYEPPLGAIGAAIDATVGYLIAQRCMSDFLKRIGETLRSRAPVAFLGSS